MTLQDYAALAQIITSIVGLFIAALGAFAAWYGYQWLRQNARVETRRRMSEARRHYNELVLANPDWLQSEAAKHTWGPISQDEMIKMYRYFLLLNASVHLWEAHVREAVSLTTYQSTMNHHANITYMEREFIKKHVLPRGYPLAYREELLYRWALIDKEGLLKSI
jgi:hypothetical protein